LRKLPQSARPQTLPTCQNGPITAQRGRHIALVTADGTALLSGPGRAGLDRAIYPPTEVERSGQLDLDRSGPHHLHDRVLNDNPSHPVDAYEVAVAYAVPTPPASPTNSATCSLTNSPEPLDRDDRGMSRSAPKLRGVAGVDVDGVPAAWPSRRQPEVAGGSGQLAGRPSPSTYTKRWQRPRSVIQVSA
jgi:hypothetical protein